MDLKINSISLGFKQIKLRLKNHLFILSAQGWKELSFLTNQLHLVFETKSYIVYRWDGFKHNFKFVKFLANFAN